MNSQPIKLRIIFMGTSAFAEHILNSLIGEKYNLISVYTQPDKKVGREQTLQPSPVKVLAQKNSLPVFTPEKLDAAVTLEIKNQKPDIIIVVAYGKILPQEILEIPGFGALNVHASLLPKYRGPSPVQNAILNGETETGTTIMLMNAGIDTGDIISQQHIKIGKDETTRDLLEKLKSLSAELLLETIPRWATRKIIPQTQNEAQATLCQLIERQDGRILWTDEAEAIYNRYRAFFPWPGIFTFWNRGDTPLRLKLNKISFLPANPEIQHHIGEVFQIGEKLGVATTSGVVILEEVQLEGKSNMAIADFLNGYPDFVGALLK